MADEKGKYEYHVVQIDLEETKESKAKEGTYHAWFWIRNFKDSETKKVRHCRFLPTREGITQRRMARGDDIYIMKFYF